MSLGSGGGLNSLKTDGDMAANWRIFAREFETFVEAYFETATEKKKVALLLYHSGQSSREIYDAWELGESEKYNLKLVMKKFEEHFVPTTNLTYERFVLLTRKQEEAESYETYMTVLKTLSKSCELGNLRESLIKDLFICGIKDHKIQQQLLKTPKIDIETALEVCRTHVAVSQRLELMRDKDEPITVDSLKDQRKKIIENCGYCGYKHPYGKCPAFGKKCITCGKLNHFSSKCRNKKGKAVNLLCEDETGLDICDGEFKIDVVGSDHKSEWYLTTVSFNSNKIELKVDSGAQCNIMSLKQFFDLGLDCNQLLPVNVTVTSFTNTKLQVVGKCMLNVKFCDKYYKLIFLIVDQPGCSNILGLQSAETLGLIKRVHLLCEDLESIIPKKYLDLFDGEVGCVSKEVNIELKDNAVPVVCPPRRIPYSLEQKVKLELDNMVKKGIIEHVEEPTEWVSQMIVVLKKDGSLRICLDPRALNLVTKRAHYPLPYIEDITAKLSGAKHFCKLDCASGFWMIPLNKRSSRLCTFQTKWGRYCFKRLPFGINVAPEIFHKIISETFRSLPNVETFQDDVFLWADTREQLINTLIQVLDIAKTTGIKFNPKKFVFDAQKITFLGHSFSQDGVSIDGEKVKAVKELKSPVDKKALQRLLGVFNYLSKYIKKYSELSAPLRELLKNDVEFLWQEHHEKALKKLKDCIINAPVLSFFNPNKDVTLQVDASSVGLGAVLLQDGQPLAYASKALTYSQQRYSQIEKELLAVCFGVDKFKPYLFSRDLIQVQTDHKPLLGVFKKSLPKIPARLQRMMLQLQPYRLNLVHTPGKYLYLADTLSRDFTKQSCDEEVHFDEVDLQISLLLEHLPMTEKNFKLIKEHFDKDHILGIIKTYVTTTWPQYKDIDDNVKPYYNIKEELSVVKGLIFKGERVLVPKSLKHYMLNKLHTGHPGISRMIDRAEVTVFWIGINQDIKLYVETCNTCQKFHSSKVKTVLQYKNTPVLPFMEVSSDVFELNNQYYLVIVDNLSNYIEVVTLPDLRSVTVISRIKSIFARHGIPSVLYTDGALYYDSDLFKKFALEWNFVHIMSSPHYPQSNGQAESAVKIVKSIFKKCFDSGEDPWLGLLNHRASPRGAANSPASILMGRNIRTNIPCTYNTLVPKLTYKREYANKENLKKRSKEWYDKSVKIRGDFQEGQNVWFKKLPKLNWEPGRVVGMSDPITPRSYVVEGEQGGVYRRNEIHIRDRKIKEEVESEQATEPITENAGEAVQIQPVEEEGNTGVVRKVITRSGREVKVPRRFLD